MEPAPPASKPLRLAGWILLAGAAFAPVLTAKFVDWDDREMVVLNPILAAGHAHDVLLSWTRPTLDLYAPLTYSCYAGLAWLSRMVGDGLQPGLFHAANLLVHLIGVLLLFLLLRRLCKDDRAALVGALVWAVHPIQTEAVAWVASLNTCLCTMLAIAALLLQTIGLQSDGGKKRTGFLIAAAIALVLSLCAKPAAVGLPLAMLGINRFILKKSWRSALAVSAGAFVIEIPFILLGAGAQPGGYGFQLTALERLAVIGHTLAFYLFKIAVPFGYTIDYGLSPDVVLASDWLRYTGLALLPIAAVLIWQWRRRPWLVAAACLFLGGIGPVCGVRNFEFQNISTVADRYSYLAMTGIALLTAFALRGRLRGAQPITIATIALLLLAAETFATTLKWHDSRTLDAATIAANPQSLAAVILEGDRAYDAGDLKGQERAFRFFLERRPMFQPLNKALAYILLNTHRPAEAVIYFQRASAVLPDAQMYNDMGLALVQTQQYDAALKALDSAIALRPRDATLHANQGEIYLQMHNPAAARQAFEAALAIDPNDPAARDGMRRAAPPATSPK